MLTASIIDQLDGSVLGTLTADGDNVTSGGLGEALIEFIRDEDALRQRIGTGNQNYVLVEVGPDTVTAAAFDEDLHPRADNGRFGSGNGDAPENKGGITNLIKGGELPARFSESVLQQSFYHGTTTPSADAILKDGFDESNLGKNSGNRGLAGEGSYFSEDAQYASVYANGPDNGTVIETRVDVRNPWEATMGKLNEGDTPFAYAKAGDFGADGPRAIREEAERRGHDAIIVRSPDGKTVMELVTFNNAQLAVTDRLTKDEALMRGYEAGGRVRAPRAAALTAAADAGEFAPLAVLMGFVTPEQAKQVEKALKALDERALTEAVETKEGQTMASVTFGMALSLSLTADGYPEDAEGMVRWEIDSIMYLDRPTSDNRVMRSVKGFRGFPLPLMAQTVKDDGHRGAVLVGRVDDATIDGDTIPAWGYIDITTLEGARTVRQIETGQLIGVSVDIGSCSTSSEGAEWTGGVDGGTLDMHDLEIIGLTLTPFPAFAETRGLVISEPIAAEVELHNETAGPDDDLEDPVTITAAAPVAPPIEWFQDPGLSGRTRLTITEDGRVFGHLAPWGECHIGLQGQCVRAPRSATGYGWFALGTMRCAEGCEIPIGTITMDTNHASKSLRARAAASHYDNTGTVVADIAVGEDEHGIWVAGAMRSGASGEQYRALRASRLSGDWRGINGNLELVAALAVNVGGFPVYEQALAASGEVQTVIAALDTEEVEIPSHPISMNVAIQPLLNELASRVHISRDRVLNETVASLVAHVRREA